MTKLRVGEGAAFGRVRVVAPGGAAFRASAFLTLALAACVPAAPAPPGPVDFESTRLWIHTPGDSVAVEVDLACTEREQEVGLTGRTELAPDAGMLFVFDPPRPGGEGFWMWETPIPLDIAFLDPAGVVAEVTSMEPCMEANPDRCPVYEAGVEHGAALEVNRGWLAENGVAPVLTILILKGWLSPCALNRCRWRA